MNASYSEVTEVSGLRFFWMEREDGAEIFCCRHADDSLTEVLSPDEVETAEELIAELATLGAGHE
jgi:hypothetical protein